MNLFGMNLFGGQRKPEAPKSDPRTEIENLRSQMDIIDKK